MVLVTALRTLISNRRGLDLLSGQQNMRIRNEVKNAFALSGLSAGHTSAKERKGVIPSGEKKENTHVHMTLAMNPCGEHSDDKSVKDGVQKLRFDVCCFRFEARGWFLVSWVSTFFGVYALHFSAIHCIVHTASSSYR